MQISETQGQSDGGLGVGLTLVKALVEEHGGRVEAASDGMGKGSTFRVWLPVLRLSPINGVGNITSRDRDVARQRSPQSRSIVLIEDIDESRRMLTSLLTLDGHTVYAQPDGESGVGSDRPVST